MATIHFAWDDQKELANRRKHRVSFDEASTVFSDEHARLLRDPHHSTHEERFLLLGFSSQGRLLVVCHTFDRRDLLIRVISARGATRRERERYGASRHES